MISLYFNAKLNCIIFLHCFFAGKKNITATIFMQARVNFIVTTLVESVKLYVPFLIALFKK